jgi:hypothetical protein
VAGLSALVWAVPFFGLIDLTTVVTQRGPEWRAGYVLEGGWGLLLTVLVALPLAALALRPGDPAALAVAWVAVLALLAAGAWAAAAPQLLLAVALGGDVGVVAALAGVRRPVVRARTHRALLVLAVLTGAGALAYAREVLAHPVVLSVTVGVDHHGVQAALALAVAGCVALGALGAGRLPPLCAAGCLAWLSLLSLAYPDVDASLGTRGGVAGLLLAAAVAAAAATARRRLTPRPATVR